MRPPRSRDEQIDIDVVTASVVDPEGFAQESAFDRPARVVDEHLGDLPGVQRRPIEHIVPDQDLDTVDHDQDRKSGVERHGTDAADGGGWVISGGEEPVAIGPRADEGDDGEEEGRRVEALALGERDHPAGPARSVELDAKARAIDVARLGNETIPDECP